MTGRCKPMAGLHLLPFFGNTFFSPIKVQLIMRKTIVFLTCMCLQIPAFGQDRDSGKIIPYDSTEYYQRLFADNSEFDIRKFTPMPEYGRRELIDAIKPAPGYEYWEWRDSDGDAVLMQKPGELVAYQGDRTYGALVALKVPESGFFAGGHHMPQYSYIVAVAGDFTEDEDLTVEMIDSEEKLIGFLGAVDNIGEVLLHSMAHGYSADRSSPVTGAYREENDRYLLYLYRRSKKDARSDESVKAILYKTGKFEVVGSVVYKTSDTLAWP